MASLDDLTRRRLLALGLAAAGGTVLGGPRALAAADGPRAASFGLAVPRGRRRIVLAAPGRFELVGLRWPGARLPLSGQVRTRVAGGAWSGWAPLHARGDHGPDAGGRFSATDPVWTGPADEFELSLDRSPPGLEARFVATRGARILPPRASAAAAPRDGRPTIVSRAQWGGSRVTPRDTPSTGSVKLAFVHHTVSSNDYSRSQSAGVVLSIARYHRDSLGWDDLGYNFLVDRFGQIFEGRAGGIERAIIGAQAQGWNAVSTGIANLGTFTEGGQSEAALDAMARLIAWKLPLHGAPVGGEVSIVSKGGGTNRHARGKSVSFDRISGHRDGCSTACPGDALYRQLPDLRRRAAGIAKDEDAPEVEDEFDNGALGTLDLAAAPLSLTGAGTVQVTGRLLDSDGRPRARARVVVEKLGPTTWRGVARLRTGADGTFATAVEIARSTRLRARTDVPVSSGGAGSGAARAAASSSLIDVTVVPIVSAALASDRVRAGRSVEIRASVQPRDTALVATVSRETEPGIFGRVATVKLRSTGGGAARGKLLLRKPGVYRVVARALPGVRAPEARSAPVLFRVTRGGGGRPGRPVSSV